MGILDKLSERVGGFLDEITLPDEVRRAHERAGRAIGRGEYDVALAAITPTLIHHPNVARSHHIAGICRFHRGEHTEALQAFDRALAIREQAPSHLYAGLSAEQLGRFHDAMRHFRRALQVGGAEIDEAAEIHFGLGRAHLAMQRPDKAAKELRKAVKLAPDELEPALALARAHMLRKDWAAAREALSGREDLGSRPDALALFAAIDEARGQLREAREAFEAALDAEPDHPTALIGAARTSLALGDHVAANQHLLRALEHTEGAARAEIYTLLGRVNEAIRNDAQARISYQGALALESSGPAGAPSLAPSLAFEGARLGLGRLALGAGEPAEAAEQFAKVAQNARPEQNPEHAQEAMWGLGVSRLLLGDVAGARHLLEEALRFEGARQADVHHALGQAALRMGDAAEAGVAFRHALDPATGEPSARKTIERDLEEALDRLRPSWDLPERLDEPAQLTHVLDRLRDYLSGDVRLAEFLPATNRLQAAMNAPLSIAIVGEFNAGKSTLVNALIGEELLPMGVLPTTAHTGTIQFGPRKAARVVYRDGSATELPFDEAKRLMKSEAERIERLEFLFPHPMLRAVHFWDTPGFNALEERHEEVAARALDEAEAILWVLDANQVLSQTEFERLEDLHAGAERLLVVINKIDRLGPPSAERDEAVAELVGYVEENLGDRMVGCFPISALQALKATTDDAASDSPADAPDDQVDAGFQAFQSLLDQRIIQRAGRIKTLEVGRQLGFLARTLEAFQIGLLDRYGRLLQAVGEVEAWLEDQAEHAPKARAGALLLALSDRVDFTLEAMEREIAEALEPAGSWTGRMTLSDEDQDFLLQLFAERFDALLERTRASVLGDVGELEAQLAERVDPVIRGLNLSDARSMQRRLEGLFDETRVLRLVFEERILGRMRARAAGRIDAGGPTSLRAIEADPEDRLRWKGALRGLLPDLGDGLRDEIEGWYTQFYDTARRFARRLRRDLELLELEARYRYDVRALLSAVGDPGDPLDGDDGR